METGITPSPGIGMPAMGKGFNKAPGDLFVFWLFRCGVIGRSGKPKHDLVWTDQPQFFTGYSLHVADIVAEQFHLPFEVGIHLLDSPVFPPDFVSFSTQFIKPHKTVIAENSEGHCYDHGAQHERRKPSAGQDESVHFFDPMW